MKFINMLRKVNKTNLLNAYKISDNRGTWPLEHLQYTMFQIKQVSTLERIHVSLHLWVES